MTEVGEHVVYHWDPSEKQIYGGTIATADRFVELIPAYYGLPLVSAGPNIEYFWSVSTAWIKRACGSAGR